MASSLAGFVLLAAGRPDPGCDAIAAALARAGALTLATAAHDGESVRAARADLLARGAGRVYVLGLGAGGSAAFLQAADEDVAGVVAIDGGPPVAEAQAGRLRAAVLALYGGAADGFAESEALAFAEALRAHHVAAETIVYDEVPAGFLDPASGDFAAARDDAIFRIARFAGLSAR